MMYSLDEIETELPELHKTIENVTSVKIRKIN